MRKYVYVLIGLGLVTGALACGSGNNSDGATPANAVNASSAPNPEKTKDGTIADGTWEVGTDIKAGKYRSTGADDDTIPLCVWSVNKDGEYAGAGTTSKISDPQLVTLKKGQTFETDGCGVWQKR